DADGNVLASGSGGARNYDLVENGIIAPSDGTYYVRITGVGQTHYTLIVARDAVLETESNNIQATAQVLDFSGGTMTVMGYLDAPRQIVIQATDSGWYDSNGFHDPANPNYFTGFVPGYAELRNYFVFDLSVLSSTDVISSAQLLLYNPV